MSRSVIIFTTVAYALSIALGLIVGLTGGHESPLRALSVGAMFIPAAAVAVVRITTGERLSVDWGRMPTRYLLPALFLIPATMHAVMLPTTIFLTGGIPWQDWLRRPEDLVLQSPVQLGWGTLSPQQVVAHMILNALVGLVFVSFLAIFEEIGWRAWLLQRLTETSGPRKAIAIVALIWSLWHVPFVLSGILYFDHVPKAAAAAILPVGEFGAGLVIGWFWFRTKSIWIVSIAHGALNDWGQFAFKFMQDEPISVFGMAFRSYEAIVLAGGSLALVALGAVLVRGYIPDSDRGKDIM